MKRTLVLLSMLLACGREPDERPDWFTEPTEPTVMAPAMNGLESNSHSLMSGFARFGSSSMGYNYDCSPSGGTCVCNPAPGTGKFKMPRSDCDDMRDVGIICTNDPVCFISPRTGKLLCACDTGAPGGGCGSDPKCGVASWIVDPGELVKVSGGDGTIFKMGLKFDRACALTLPQWNSLGAPAPRVISGDQATYIGLVYSKQFCSGVEAGTKSNDMLDDHYRAPDGTIAKKAEGRMCMETFTFWQGQGSPTPIQLTQSGWNSLIGIYGDAGAQSAVKLCNDMDK